MWLVEVESGGKFDERTWKSMLYGNDGEGRWPPGCTLLGLSMTSVCYQFFEKDSADGWYDRLAHFDPDAEFTVSLRSSDKDEAERFERVRPLTREDCE